MKRVIKKSKLFFKDKWKVIYQKLHLAKVEKSLKKFNKNVKKAYKKVKYLDKTSFRFYIVTGFIGIFCTFVTTTYSVFTLSKTLNAAIITIAKLNYSLSSPDSEFNNGVVTVEAGKTIGIDLSLESLNSEQTKYALNYATENPDVEVYYSMNYDNNMQGTIGAEPSTISMRIVIVNNSNSNATVNLTVAGGYVHNTLTSNITEGYYESDIVARIYTEEADFSNVSQVTEFPSASAGYVYYDTTCNEPTTPVWNSESTTLNLNNITKRIVCNVYFKKLSYDIEIYYELRDVNGLNSERATEVPNDGSYTFQSVHCSNSDAQASWSNEDWKLTVSNITQKTLCVALFNANS